MLTIPEWLAAVLLAGDSVGLAWTVGGEIGRHRTRSHREATRAALVIAAARVHSR